MILNYTNRDLVFVRTDNLTALLNGKYTIEKKELLLVDKILPRQPKPLTCHVRLSRLASVQGIAVTQERLVRIDPIPEGEEILIVSRQYAEACRYFCLDTSRLYIVTGAVYTPTQSTPVATASISSVEQCLYFEKPTLFAITDPNIITQSRLIQ